MAQKSDPYATAMALGIEIREEESSPWDVGSDGHIVLCAPHPDPRVAEARAWEGIAQCLLTRRGDAWTPDQAIALGAVLSLRAPTFH